MNKLKYVKLENEDGSYSSSIPLAVDSDYVDVNGETLTNKLNNKAEKSQINNLQNQISGLASGSPLVASSVSDMTDTTRVYVNTTDGHWYWYDGSDWQDGGVYQATEDSQTVEQLVKDVDDINDGFDIIISENKLNPNKMTTGMYYHTGNISTNESYYYSELIPVSAGSTVYFSKSSSGKVTVRELAAFDDNGSVVSDSGATNLQQEYVVPNGITGIRISLSKSTFPAENVCVTIDENIGFIAWSKPYYIIKSPYFKEYVQKFSSIYKVNATMSFSDIQRILEINENKLVIFEAGTYNFGNSLYVNSNTKIILNNCDLYFTSVISFRNSKETDNVTGYNGQSNIEIVGGNIYYACVLLSHGENIKFKNVNFKKANYQHFVQICACKNVDFDLCDFDGMADAVSQTSSEMLQFDPCQYSNFPYYNQNSSSYDGTPNRNININKCKFLKGAAGSGYTSLVIAIGTHDNNNSTFEDIFVKDCYFDECSRATIEPCNWKNVILKNNHAKDSNAFVWQFSDCEDVKVINNTIEKALYVYKMETTATCNNLLIKDNENFNCIGGFPYRIYNTSNIRIVNDHVKNGASCLCKVYNTVGFIFMNNVADTFMLDGNTNGLIIADDCANILSMDNAFLNITFNGQDNIIYETNTKENSKFIESKNDVLI